MLREGILLQICKYFLIELNRLFDVIFLKFGDGKDMSVVVFIFVVYCFAQIVHIIISLKWML